MAPVRTSFVVLNGERRRCCEVLQFFSTNFHAPVRSSLSFLFPCSCSSIKIICFPQNCKTHNLYIYSSVIMKYLSERVRSIEESRKYKFIPIHCISINYSQQQIKKENIVCGLFIKLQQAIDLL